MVEKKDNLQLGPCCYDWERFEIKMDEQWWSTYNIELGQCTGKVELHCFIFQFSVSKHLYISSLHYLWSVKKEHAGVVFMKTYKLSKLMVKVHKIAWGAGG